MKQDLRSWRKYLEKSNKTGKNKNILLSAFEYFLTTTTRFLLLLSQTWHWALFPPNLRFSNNWLISALCEKCPNTEIVLVGIFPYSDWNGDLLRKSPYLVKIRENTDHNNILSLKLFCKLCGQSLKQSFLHYISRTTLLVVNRASTSEKNEVFH